MLLINKKTKREEKEEKKTSFRLQEIASLLLLSNNISFICDIKVRCFNMNLLESFCVGGLLLIICSPLLKKLYKRWILERTINKIPGPKTYPLIGTSFHFSSVPRESNKSFLIYKYYY